MSRGWAAGAMAAGAAARDGKSRPPAVLTLLTAKAVGCGTARPELVFCGGGDASAASASSCAGAGERAPPRPRCGREGATERRCGASGREEGA